MNVDTKVRQIHALNIKAKNSRRLAYNGEGDVHVTYALLWIRLITFTNALESKINKLIEAHAEARYSHIDT